MTDTTATVASIVLDHSESAPIFQRHRIDYCCRGQMSLADACASRGVDPLQVLGEIEQAIAARKEGGDDPRSLSTPALVERIVGRHHAYLRQTMPFLKGLAAKVARVHGDHQPSLRELDRLVVEIIGALEPHLDQEERVLFPALTSASPDGAVVRRELSSMHEDHLAVGRLLEQIRDVTSNFAPAEWACGSYRVLYSELEALEGDTLRHVHLENHVLMPRFL